MTLSVKLQKKNNQLKQTQPEVAFHSSDASDGALEGKG